jgi:hypothetical protein
MVKSRCETWPLTLMEYTGVVQEQGAEKNIWTEMEVMGGWRKLHNKELRDLYSSPSIIIIMK